MDNLQATCRVCNIAKSSYLPDDFQDRVFDTLCFQMEKKYGASLKWKILHKALEKWFESAAGGKQRFIL